MEVPYIPQEQSLLQEEFRQRLEASGRVLVCHRPLLTDPLVLRQRWLTTPGGKQYDTCAFYHVFDNAIFRQALRLLLTQSPLSSLQLASFTLDSKQLTFLEEQEFLTRLPSFKEKPQKHTETSPFNNTLWKRGTTGQGISNIGHTLEWYVAEWFRREYQAHACHGVVTQELTVPGDLDVVALKEEQSILVECKSSSHIPEHKLRLLLQRATIFQPHMTVLLIDTTDSAPIEARTRQLCQLLDQPYDPGRQQIHGKTVFRWIAAQNLYVSNTGAGIAATLAALLHFHEALTLVRLYR